MTNPYPSPLAALLCSDSICRLQDNATERWHHDSSAVPESNAFIDIVLAQHLSNFQLWHIEDRARNPHVLDSELAALKRAVDCTNQLRNDLTERCDVCLLAALEECGLPFPNAELHSETPGLMIDRLSILALKIFHTREEIIRLNAPKGHSERNNERLQVLELQRTDLAHCLDDLWHQTLRGGRRFKLYRQLKMYNDPSLNPAIYGTG